MMSSTRLGFFRAFRYPGGFLAGLLMLSPLLGWGQNVAFYDDFSGDLSKWKELGNPGAPQIVNGQLQLEWGHAPNWFVTAIPFSFGSEAYRVDMNFMGGGWQASANYKEVYMEPLLGATDPNAANGAVRVTFSYQSFAMQRRTLDANGNPVWQNIVMTKNPFLARTIHPGSRIKIEIDPDGVNGSYYIDGELINRFKYLGDPLQGGFGFRLVVQRNVKVDDVRLYQVASNGSVTVILEDDFNRTDLGTNWVNETLAGDTTPGPLQATIHDGILFLENDGSGDTWLRTAQEVTFTGNTTVFEFTFVDYLGTVVYNPTVVAGTKPYTPGQTSGVVLFDNGPGFNYAMEGGSWAGGRVQSLSGVQSGMTFQVVVDQGGQAGRTYRNGVEVARFVTLGPPLQGAFAFRSIYNRDAAIDDLRIYTRNDDGTETTLFVDNFNRNELGEDWVVESITPGGLVEALVVDLFDEDNDGDNELYLDHDETLEDNWLRLKKDLPFTDATVVIEGTYTYLAPNSMASVVLGAQQWTENQLWGPLLLDNLETAWGMDTRGGNVWVRYGPIGGTKVSILVNADARSGAFLTNDILIAEWELGPDELPIPPGAIGFNDHYTSPQTNVAPGSGTAVMLYDEVRVTRLGTAVPNWMIF
ncbi:MAG: hypothetical protein HPY51_03840 [Candidatus Omnitrophica bacterium]|nr:hypothetical protein [Candidatus Omnitrophota bacterium]